MTASASRPSGIGRTSLAASAGTLGSTVIGFGRTLALAAAIGTGLVADSYNIANQVPNLIFLLLGGGTVGFVFVPQLIHHARASQERGDEYGSLLLFGAAAFGLFVSLALLALSPAVIRLMGGSSWGEAQSSLGLHLALWCIPQIFFYALYSVASQLMNARGYFSSVAWIPTANSVVVILACIPIIVVGSVTANAPGSMEAWEIGLLGGSTLLGSALQAVLIITLLRDVGFRLSFRFPLRGLHLRATAATGLVTIAAAGSIQIANLITAALSTRAGSDAKALGFDGHGYTAFFYARTLMIVAQSVAAASVANVLLQRLSRHYAEGDDQTASSELNEAILAVGALLIPVASALVCLGPLGTELLFARGETSREAAHFIGTVLSVLSVGLIPYALHDILIRPFFAVRNAMRVLQSSVAISAIWVAGAFAAAKLLPPQYVPLGIAAAFAVAYLADLPFKLWSLSRRLNFRISSKVAHGYVVALSAGLLAASITLAGLTYLRELPTADWLIRSAFLLGGTVVFLGIYYPLTARSAISLRHLVRWLRT